ncbi:hypothetical protein MHB54_17045 [Paenibacillus sp. FSL M7-0802]|jgi:hypothetical protein|uniref:hypothetical protein n=1 Tax=Paenibacillus sp. FSL M7-0802 TaxID=2921536 RepID=UPI001E2E2598|nr:MULTISPECIES: hypothetical protein [Paenibacillus]
MPGYRIRISGGERIQTKAFLNDGSKSVDRLAQIGGTTSKKHTLMLGKVSMVK